MEKQIRFTAEECYELTTTIMGRLLYIAEMQEKAASEKDAQRIADLQHIIDVHKAILEKLTR